MSGSDKEAYDAKDDSSSTPKTTSDHVESGVDPAYEKNLMLVPLDCSPCKNPESVI